MEMKDRAIITALAAKQRELQAGCECGGSGKVEVKRDEHLNAFDPVNINRDKLAPINIGPYLIPCPTCAEIRELGNVLKVFSVPLASPIGFTTALHGTKWLLRHYLEVLGMWDKFLDWLRVNLFENKYADILTDGLLLRDAVYAWMEAA